VDLNNFDFNKKLLANRREFLLANRLFWLYQNKDAAIFYDDRRWSNALDKYIEHGIFYLPDIKALLPKIELLIELGLFELIKLDNLDQIYSKGDRAVIEFFNRALNESERIKRNFGISVSEQISPIYLINLLLKKVGLQLRKQKKRVNGELTNLYQIDRQILNDRDRAIILEASDRKYQMALIENGRNKESTVPPVSTNIENQKERVEQNQVVDEVEDVPPIPINIETDKVGVEHLNIAVEEQADVPPVPINIENQKVGVEHLNIEVEEQTDVPPIPINIENQEVGVEQNQVVDEVEDVPPVAINIENQEVGVEQNQIVDEVEDVPPVAINIETDKLGVEHLNIEVEEQTSVPPVAINIENQKVGVEHLNIEVDEQTDVPPVSTYIENQEVGVEHLNVEAEEQISVPPVPTYIENQKVGVEHLNIEQESQTAVPSDAIYIETDRLGVGQNESQFILGLLEDLEEQSPRFKSQTQIEELYSLEFEARIKAVEAEILSVCPDFYSRWITAVSTLGETLPAAIKLDKVDGNFSASHYLERWQKKIGHEFQFISNEIEKLISVIGKFVGLEMINNECLVRAIVNGITYYCKPNNIKFTSN
ncbi:MAG: hypothetical protein QNJ38_15350, partial [Prochloraceae cyanobacterium]|nr:hypothetical protein [Prochloraceae cyanobacterium]